MDAESPPVKKSDALFVGFLFVASLTIAVAIVIHGLQGRYFVRISWSTVAVAIGGFAMLGSKVLGRMIPVGVALWGAGATVRLLTYYLHASHEVQQLVAINERLLTLMGCALIVVGGIRWFRETDLRRLISEEKEPLSLGLK